MPGADRSHAIDHIVVVLFENRSLDNVLGHLYGPEDDKNFDGVIGKELSNPIPEWAEHGADRKVVPYTVATDMDAPNPDSGEEWFHTNTQLFIDDLFTLQTPRDPETWATVNALPVPAWHLDGEALGNGLSGLGNSMGRGIIDHARALGLELPPQLADPAAEPTPEDIIELFRQVAWHYFPLLAPDKRSAAQPAGT